MFSELRKMYLVYLWAVLTCLWRQFDVIAEHLRLISWLRSRNWVLPHNLPHSLPFSLIMVGMQEGLKFAFVYLVSNSSSGKSENFLQCTQLTLLLFL